MNYYYLSNYKYFNLESDNVIQITCNPSSADAG